MIKDILDFLSKHLDLFELLYNALNGGVDKKKLMAQIKKEMVDAAYAAAKAELGDA